jgi:hypothetical protein
MSTPSQIPATTLRDVLATKIHVTDDELRLLSAVDRVKVLKAMVHEAVEAHYGLALSWDEKVLVILYRDWLASPKSTSGIFHCKIPSFERVREDMLKRLEAEGKPLTTESDVRGHCPVCDKDVLSSDDYWTNNYGEAHHADCLARILKERNDFDA